MNFLRGLQVKQEQQVQRNLRNLELIALASGKNKELREAYEKATEEEKLSLDADVFSIWAKIVNWDSDNSHYVPGTGQVFDELDRQIETIEPGTKRWKRMVQAFDLKPQKASRYGPGKIIGFSDRAYEVDKRGSLRRLPPTDPKSVQVREALGDPKRWI